MEERLLKFARIVDAGSFTKAAQELHISQPALTTAVKKLERELASELIVRSSRGLTMTAAGELAYDTAKQLATEAQNLRVQLAEQDARKVSLRLGLIDSLADLLFVHGGYLHELQQTSEASLTIDNSARLIELVEHDKLDMALVARPARLSSSLTARGLASEPLLFVCQAKNADLCNQELAQKQLRHFLCYNRASRTFRLISEHFAQHGITIEPSFYSTSPEIMLQLALGGGGAAVLPLLLVKPHLKTGQLVPVTLGTGAVITRQIVEVRRRGRKLPAQAQALAMGAQKQLQQLGREAQGFHPKNTARISSNPGGTIAYTKGVK